LAPAFNKKMQTFLVHPLDEVGQRHKENCFKYIID